MSETQLQKTYVSIMIGSAATGNGPDLGTARSKGCSLTSDSGLLVLLKVIVDKAEDEGRLGKLSVTMSCEYLKC